MARRSQAEMEAPRSWKTWCFTFRTHDVRRAAPRAGRQRDPLSHLRCPPGVGGRLSPLQVRVDPVAARDGRSRPAAGVAWANCGPGGRPRPSATPGGPMRFARPAGRAPAGGVLSAPRKLDCRRHHGADRRSPVVKRAGRAAKALDHGGLNLAKRRDAGRGGGPKRPSPVRRSPVNHGVACAARAGPGRPLAACELLSRLSCPVLGKSVAPTRQENESWNASGFRVAWRIAKSPSACWRPFRHRPLGCAACLSTSSEPTTPCRKRLPLPIQVANFLPR